MSSQNPYRVLAGYVIMSNLDPNKNQASLGMKAVFHPDPLTNFVLIMVLPAFEYTLFVDFRGLRFNTEETVNENCETIYWTKVKHLGSTENIYYYDYVLVNQIPCVYHICHTHNTEDMVLCPIEHESVVDMSAAVICNSHFMGFVEFGRYDGKKVFYHKITNKVIEWMRQQTTDET
ncbi:uncharacterized protein LOC126900638 isoform X2 [Daktulosphaira vitifoliae]|nr:uncharacterized protein LOC126900638 isoform X2 [Daktulosphaira vitifoliae]